MRTTLNLDDDLINQAREATGIQEKTRLVQEGLKALLAREAGRHLASMGGSQKDISVPPRRRPAFPPRRPAKKTK